MLSLIFCPKCKNLILDQPACSVCGWQRPVEAEGVGDVAWIADLGTRLVKPHCYPVVAAGLYHLGTEDGTLLALDLASGEVTWERPLPDGCMAYGLATDGSYLFVGCEDMQPIPTPGKALLVLEAATGEEVWQVLTPAHSLSAAMVADGAAYFTSSDGWLHAVDAGTGQRRWAVEHPAWGPAAPVVGEAIVCAGGRGEDLVAYDVRDGAEQWRFRAEDWFAARLCADHDLVYARCWDGHLYALEAQTGHVRWLVSGERGSGFTCDPVVSDELVFIGSRAYRPENESQIEAYAMLALSARDGSEAWRFYTDRHIFAPAAAADASLFFGDNRGTLFAVDINCGQERWRREGKGRLVTEPLVASDLVLFGGRDGLIHAIRWRAKLQAESLDPGVYEAEGRYAEAATAYALSGELDKAASLYAEKLGGHREAAQLYERAGQPGEAAIAWEAAGELHRARDLYQETGDRSGLASLFERMGEPLEAARLYEEIEQLEKSAALYEQAGDRVRAANLYRQAGRFDLAVPIWESLGRWEKQADDLIAQGELAQAALVLEEYEQWERAAGLYEEVGELAKALALRRLLGHWERVAELAHQVGDYEQGAGVLEQLGRPLLAAESYERAGEQTAAAKPPDKALAATLYERAAHLYAEHFEEERATAARRQVQRLRRLPELVIHGEAEEAFVEYQWNTLTLRVENIGYGTACWIQIQLHGEFDVHGQTTLDGLRPGRAKALALYLRPHKEQYGPKVPLELMVGYQDLLGGQYAISQQIPVRVVEKGVLPGLATPLELHIHGDLMQPGTKKEVGDRVEIQRNGGQKLTRADGGQGNQTAVRREGLTVLRCPHCNLPLGEETYRYCPDCGTPLQENGG